MLPLLIAFSRTAPLLPTTTYDDASQGRSRGTHPRGYLVLTTSPWHIPQGGSRIQGDVVTKQPVPNPPVRRAQHRSSSRHQGSLITSGWNVSVVHSQFIVTLPFEPARSQHRQDYCIKNHDWEAPVTQTASTHGCICADTTTGLFVMGNLDAHAWGVSWWHGLVVVNTSN